MKEAFVRHEKKYLLDDSQKELFLDKTKEYLELDKCFSRSDIHSIYYDTSNFELIRRSIEKPEYKEKLRVRAYGNVKDEDEVFVELKKKYDGIVYKRRTKAKSKDVLNDIYNCDFKDKQVGEELRYALKYYKELRPAIYVACKRISYQGIEDNSIRITFDSSIKYRMEELDFHENKKDKILTDNIVMEIKVKDAMPLWLSKTLDEIKAYPRGFSKVGTAYLKTLEGE